VFLGGSAYCGLSGILAAKVGHEIRCAHASVTGEEPRVSSYRRVGLFSEEGLRKASLTERYLWKSLPLIGEIRTPRA
jgi:hypothetical protein